MLVRTNDPKFAEANEAIVLAAVAGSDDFPSNFRVKLRSMNTVQLCKLFDHCYLYNLGEFVTQNKLVGINDIIVVLSDNGYLIRSGIIGVHLEDGIESVEDLTDLGLDKLNAKVLFKNILVWKADGLPKDFYLQLDAEPVFSSTLSMSSPINHTAQAEKQLDDDFIRARWLSCPVATDRIVLAASTEYILAKAYLSILYDKPLMAVAQNKEKAAEYAAKALPWLKENADKGNKYAQFNLAMCYEDGRGVNKDLKAAIKRAQVAADQNHSGAQYFLGLCYDERTGEIFNEAEAARYYQLAADQGHVDAQYNLAVCYEEGLGIRRDDQEAFRYNKLAADQGDVEGQYTVGNYYAQGMRGRINKMEAVRYYLRAAEKGHSKALRKLSDCHI